ncbi:MAG: hypothetical protein KDC49_00770 [Saprospiraceae bacterium]|nr:hypothetical protein [Saprospiraceae bacterium]
MRLYFIASIAISSFLFTFLSCKNDSSVPAAPDTRIVIRLADNPERINPILFPSGPAREVYQYIFLPMAELDGESLEFIPVMIKNIPVLKEDNGKISLSVEILEEASWSDGKPVTADDYIFTLKTIFHPECNTFAYKYLVDQVDSVSVDSENKKKFTIYFSDYAMQLIESALSFEILPAHLYDPDNNGEGFSLADLKNEEKTAALDSTESYHRFAESFNSQKYSAEIIEGSGPYAFIEWKPNESIVIKRKENYWGSGKGQSLDNRPSEIVFAIIPDEVSALTQLSEGKIDVISNVSQNSLSLFEDSLKMAKNFEVLKVQQPRYFVLLLNHKHPALSEPAVRKALDMLHNDPEYIEVFENGEGIDMYSFVPEFLPGHSKEIPPTVFNPEQAKAELQAAGWNDTNSDGTLDKVIGGKKQELKLRYLASGGQGINIGLLFKDACAKAGIAIEVVQKDFALIRKENIATDDFEVVASVMSVDLFLENPFDTYHSSNIETSNPNNYQSSTSDSLITVITETRDQKVRLAAHAQLQKQIKQDAVMLFLYSPISRIAISNKWDAKVYFTRPGYKANTFVPAVVN